MTRFSKTSNGKYRVNGMTHEMLSGSRAQVWHGTSHKTSGGLTKKDLMQNKSGRIVSRAKHSTAKKEMRLVKAGYGTKKGKFGFVKLGNGSRKSKSKKMRGGTTQPNNNLNNPININSGGPTLGIPGIKLGGKKGKRGGQVSSFGDVITPAPFHSKGGSNRRRRRGGQVSSFGDVITPAPYHSKGGMNSYPLSPSNYNGKGEGTSGVALQFIAGQGN